MPRLPIIENKEPRIGGSGSNLLIYLDPVNSDQMKARFGPEKSIRREGALEVTRGTAYRTRSGTPLGMRYLWHAEDDAIVAAINITRMNRVTVISNIYVRPDKRNQGLAKMLLAAVMADFPRVVVDASLTEDGARFFGYSNEAPVAPPAPETHTLRRITP